LNFKIPSKFQIYISHLVPLVVTILGPEMPVVFCYVLPDYAFGLVITCFGYVPWDGLTSPDVFMLAVAVL